MPPTVAILKHRHTQHGWSRTQHVRDCEADIERAKKWGPGHF